MSNITDPRLAWFVMGAVFGAVLFGELALTRFSRYSRRGSNPPSPDRKPTPPPAPPPPLVGRARLFINNPVQIAKFIDPSMGVPWDEGSAQRGNGSGGTTTPKPPIKPQFPPPRKIREDFLE